MTLKTCLIKHRDAIHKDDKADLKHAAEVYQSQGMTQQQAEEQAIVDKLDELKAEREAITKQVLDMFKAEKPKQYQSIFGRKPKDSEQGKVEDADSLFSGNKSDDNAIAQPQGVVKELYEKLGEIKDNNDLKRIAAQRMGVTTSKVTPDILKVWQEHLEAAITHAARVIAQSGKDMRSVFDALVNLYEKQPRLNVRTGNSIRNQAYSTPAPLAYLAGKMAGVNSATRVYEPTAGNGMLLITANQKKAIVNELDPERAQALRDAGYQVHEGDALKFNPQETPDAVLANPPFGAMDKKEVYQGYTFAKIDHLIAAKALDTMADDGKAVIILGAQKEQGNLSTGVDAVFFGWLYSHYNVAGHFELDGKMYERQGAGWPVRVITVDGRKENGQPMPMLELNKLIKNLNETVERFTNWGDVYDAAAKMVGTDEQGIADSRSDISQPDGKAGDNGTTEATDDKQNIKADGRGGRGGGRGGRSGITKSGTSVQAGNGRPNGELGDSPEDAGHGNTNQLPSGATGDKSKTETTDSEGDLSGSGKPNDGNLHDSLASPYERRLGKPFEAMTLDELYRIPLSDEASMAVEDIKRHAAAVERLESQGEPIASPPKENPAPKPNKPTKENTGGSKTAGTKSSGTKTAKTNTAPKPQQQPKQYTEAELDGLSLDELDALLIDGLPSNRIRPQLNLDEVYEQKKPILKKIYDALVAAGKTFLDFKNRVEALLGDIGRTFVTRFRVDMRSGAFDKPQNTPAPESVQGVMDAEGSDYQVPYTPKSKGANEAVLMPKNMAEALGKALDEVESKHGDIDEYVKTKLGYKSIEDIYKGLMALQIDGVALAISNHEDKGEAVIIADQTGVGKGRQAAAMLAYAVQNGYTPVFVTVGPNMYQDMHEELHAIGKGNLKPLVTNVGKDGRILDKNGNVLFSGDTKKMGAAIESVDKTGGLGQSGDMVFTTYDQLSAIDKNPRRTLLDGIKKPFFVLDESHNAAGEVVENKKGGEKRAQFMRRILMRGRENGQSGVAYLSATYAKRPDNMPFYMRTALGQIVDTSPLKRGKEDKLAQVFKAGSVRLQTLIAGVLTASGQLIRRERSFKGIPISKLVDKDPARNAKVEKNYDVLADLLNDIASASRAFKRMHKENKEYFLGVATRLAGNKTGADRSSVNDFTSVVHNEIRKLVLALKVDFAAEQAIADAKAGHKPVLALENTLGSFLQDYADNHKLKDGDVIKGNYSDMLQIALQRVFRVSVPDGKGGSEPVQLQKEHLPPLLRHKWNEISKKIAASPVGDLPFSPLDMIMHKLREAGVSVAEITGRSGYVDYSSGVPIYRTRSNSDKNKNKILSAFNNGETTALLINRAGSTGLSAHASVKFPTRNQKRVMHVLQPLLDINIMVQMLGRINRTGQVTLPEYKFLTLSLPAETRPTAICMRKLKSLNANTSANSDSDTSLESPDFLNMYGDRVVNEYLADSIANGDEVPMHNQLGMAAPTGTPEDDLSVQFTGRMALLPVEKQREVETEILNRYEQLIDMLNSTGENELIMRDIPLKAWILGSTVLEAGKNPNSPLGGDLTLHKVSAVVQDKVPTSAAAKAIIDDGGNDSAIRDIIKEKFSDEGLKPIQDGLNERIAKLEAERTKLEAEPIKQKDGAEEARKKKLDAISKKIVDAMAAHDRRMASIARLKTMLSEVFVHGRRFFITVDGDIHIGVVRGVKHKKGSTFYMDSAYKIETTVNMPRGLKFDMPIPLAESMDIMPIDGLLQDAELKKEKALAELENLKSAGGWQYREQKAQFDKAEAAGEYLTLKDIFNDDHRTTANRETRYIATGNPIAGTEQFLLQKRIAKIVNFTAASGETHSGFLLNNSKWGRQIGEEAFKKDLGNALPLDKDSYVNFAKAVVEASQNKGGGRIDFGSTHYKATNNKVLQGYRVRVMAQPNDTSITIMLPYRNREQPLGTALAEDGPKDNGGIYHNFSKEYLGGSRNFVAHKGNYVVIMVLGSSSKEVVGKNLGEILHFFMLHGAGAVRTTPEVEPYYEALGGKYVLPVSGFDGKPQTGKAPEDLQEDADFNLTLEGNYTPRYQTVDDFINKDRTSTPTIIRQETPTKPVAPATTPAPTKAPEKTKEPAAPANPFKEWDDKDTRNDKPMYMVKAVKSLERPDFEAMQNLARSHGGGYSRFKKGLAFGTPEARQAFIDEAQKTIPALGGGVIRPSLETETGKKKPLGIEKTRAIVERIVAANGAAGAPVYVGFPDTLSRLMTQNGSKPSEFKAVYWDATNSVYVNPDTVSSELELESAILHELTHDGIGKFFGTEVIDKLSKLYFAVGGRKYIKALAEKHGMNFKRYEDFHGKLLNQEYTAKERKYRETGDASLLTPDEKARLRKKEAQIAKERMAMQMEEVLAFMGQNNRPSVQRFLRELAGMIKAFLRERGFLATSKVSESELYALLRNARKANGDFAKMRYESERANQTLIDQQAAEDERAWNDHWQELSSKFSSDKTENDAHKSDKYFAQMNSSVPLEPSLSEKKKAAKEFVDSLENNQVKEGLNSLGDPRTIRQKVTDVLKDLFHTHGMLGDDIGQMKIKRDAEINADTYGMDVLLRQFNNDIQQAFGVPYEKLAQQVKTKINGIMRGEYSVPPSEKFASLGRTMDAMRGKIESFSEAIAGQIHEEAAALEEKAQDTKISGRKRAQYEIQARMKRAQAKAIWENRHEYLNRSYRAFDDENWPNTVREFHPKVYDKAVNWLAKDAAAHDALGEFRAQRSADIDAVKKLRGAEREKAMQKWMADYYSAPQIADIKRLQQEKSQLEGAFERIKAELELEGRAEEHGAFVTRAMRDGLYLPNGKPRFTPEELAAHAGFVAKLEQYEHDKQALADTAQYLKDLKQSAKKQKEAEKRYSLMGTVEPTEEHYKNAAAEANAMLHEGTKFDTAAHAMFKEPRLGAKDMSVFKKRKTIPKELRELLGEYEDAPINYAKTISKLSRVVHNHEFQTRLKEFALATGLVTEEQTATNTKLLADDNNSGYAPLMGLYTNHAFNKALKDAMTKPQFNPVTQFYFTAQAMVKLGMTVYSPASSIRNAVGGMMFCFMNGHFNLKGMADFPWAAHFRHEGNGTAYMEELIRRGVLYESPHQRELQTLLEDSRLDTIMKAIGAGDLAAKLKLPEISDFMQKAYAMGDDLWKVIGYELERKDQERYFGLSPELAKREAAERIRNTYPTYSLNNKLVQSFRRNVLVAPFAGFTGAIIRNIPYIIKYAIQDTKQLGITSPYVMKKWAGLAVGAAGVSMLAMALNAHFGTDDDDDEARRITGPDWQENSILATVGKRGKQDVTLDIGNIDPYSYMKKPFIAIGRAISGRISYAEAMMAAMWELSQPFLSPEVITGRILEVLKNRRQSGGQIYNPDDPQAWQAMTKHIVDGVMPPLVRQLAVNIPDAISGKKFAYGQRELSDEIGATVGFRVSTGNPRKALSSQGVELGKALMAAHAKLNHALLDANSVDDRSLLKSYEAAKQMQSDAYQKALRVVRAATRQGLSSGDVKQVLLSAGVSHEDASYLLQGKERPMQVSTETVRKNAKKTGVKYDDAGFKREALRRLDVLRKAGLKM